MIALKLTLACALILLRLAHCSTTHSDDGTIAQCNGVTLEFKLTNGRARSLTVKNRGDIVYRYSQGDFKVTCSGTNATRLTLTKDKKELHTKQTSDTTVMSILEADPTQREYVCTDMDTHCNASALFSVLPTISVNLANVSRNRSLLLNEEFSFSYTIQYGNDIKVMCSYPSAARLKLTKDGRTLPTEKVNETTIMWFASKPDLQISKFVCADVNTTENHSIVIRVEPVIYILLSHEDIKLEGFDGNTRTHVYFVTYGTLTEMICSGPSSVKIINPEEHNKELLTEKINQTTVKALIRKFKTAVSFFSCIDSEVPDYMSTIRVIVRPRIEVISPVIRRVGRLYIIKYGDPLEIICSGPDAASLSILLGRQELKEEIQTVNRSTIKAIIKLKETRHFPHIYTCRVRFEEVDVTVGVLPAAVGFRCMSHNLAYMKCSWTTSGAGANFTLFSILNGNPTRICAKASSYEEAYGCVFWYSADSPGYPKDVTTFSFLMQSCYEFGCSNQTFLIDHASIVKPDAPWLLRVHNTSSHGAVLRWRPGGLAFADTGFWAGRDFYHKIKYWYSGIQPRDVNTSQVFCKFDCIIKLELPCPGQLYQVWVYHKLKKAVGEEFWSDPSSVTFYTDKEDDELDIDDPTCYRKPRKTKEVMTYFVQELRENVRQNLRQYKKKVKSLQEKRAKILDYMRDRQRP